MTGLAEMLDLIGRAGSYAGLDFATDTTDPARGARMQRVEERSHRDQHQAAVLRARVGRAARRAGRHAARRRPARVRPPPPALRAPLPPAPADRARGGHPHREGGHRPQRVGAAVRRADVERSPSSSTARRRRSKPALAQLHAPDRDVRRTAAEAVTAGLEPGLRTRAFVLNTLLADKAIDDRLRHFDSWIASRNLSNEASDESVQALVDAVQGRYSIPQRWYALKAQLLGLDRIADYDRMASVADVEAQVGWRRAQGARARRVRVVLGRARRHRAAVLRRARGSTRRRARASGPARSARTRCRRTTRTCCFNWTSRRRDVLTLAHELGHGLHAYLARGQGVFHQTHAADARRDRVGVRRDRHVRPAARRGHRSAGAARVARVEPRGPDRDGVPPDRDEPLRGRDAHRAARGGRAVGRATSASSGPTSQTRDARRLGRDHRGLPHVVVVHPALHRHARLRVRVRVRPAARAVGVRAVRGRGAPTSCRSTSTCLRAGGSMSPEELGKIVDVDLADPGVLGPRPRHHRAPTRRDDRGRRGRREGLVMTYRVIQWSTGNVGVAALRCIIAIPSSSSSACGCTRADKAGKDAGELCGLAAHRRARDERRRRAARARRRLRLLHRDRRPAPDRRDHRHGAHPGVGQERRVELGRRRDLPAAPRARDAQAARRRVRRRAACRASRRASTRVGRTTCCRCCSPARASTSRRCA